MPVFMIYSISCNVDKSILSHELCTVLEELCSMVILDLSIQQFSRIYSNSIIDVPITVPFGWRKALYRIWRGRIN